MKCEKHPDVELECLAGEPAHSANWHCPKCESVAIDWDKPLVCEIDGEEKKATLTCLGIDLCNIACDGVGWTARKATGEPIPGWMPRVYNAKRKPKEGEWWVFDSKRVNYFSGVMFLTGPDGVPITRGKPLYPLIKDPSFKEQKK